jgi:cytochrome P450
MVLDYPDVKRALSDHDAFSANVAPSRGERFEWLLFMDPPRHTHLRAIVSRAFTPRSIANLEPRIRALSGELLDRVIARGEMDLAADYAVPLPLMVIAEMIGLPAAGWQRLPRWSEAIVNLGVTVVGTPEEAKAAGEAFSVAEAEMAAEVDLLLAARRADPRDDLITRLALAEVDGQRLTDEEILRFFQLLLAAGTETTTNLIDNAVLCLLENPGELARLRATPDLLVPAIEEVLRYRSPGQAMFRATKRPAGQLVLAMVGAANRDPGQFTAPERFDIGRDPNPHIAFGHGIHFCLGAALSRLEARIAVGDLLARLGSFRRASQAPWPPRRAFHVHGPTRLPIVFEPERSSPPSDRPLRDDEGS